MPSAPARVPKARREANRVDVDVRHPDAKAAAGLKTEARRFLERMGLEGCELSISLVTDQEIRALNRRWRKKDRPTDVLSFPAHAPPKGTPGPLPIGDVVISIDTTTRQALLYQRPFREELSRYLAHGLLHLLGYDHVRKAGAAAMAAKEKELLGRAGMVPTSGVTTRRS